MRLFATDLDGTLVTAAGVHPRDAAAIRSARDRGVIVTIATGRLRSSTRELARALGIEAPVVCADGGSIVCARTDQILERTTIGSERAHELLDTMNRARLVRFVLTHDEVHSCEAGVAHHGYVSGWSPVIRTHSVLEHAAAWQEPESVVMVVGIGDRAEVERVVREVDRASDVEVLRFEVRDRDRAAVRVSARGANKGAGLAKVALALGVPRERVAVMGDWHNDTPMFAWASQSYAMPHAPTEVRGAATHVLAEGAPRRGALSEALDHWLGSSS